jgi:hypothetical protein
MWFVIRRVDPDNLHHTRYLRILWTPAIPERDRTGCYTSIRDHLQPSQTPPLLFSLCPTYKPQYVASPIPFNHGSLQYLVYQQCPKRMLSNNQQKSSHFVQFLNSTPGGYPIGRFGGRSTRREDMWASSAAHVGSDKSVVER